jgi:hypothetical protein
MGYETDIDNEDMQSEWIVRCGFLWQIDAGTHGQGPTTWSVGVSTQDWGWYNI